MSGRTECARSPGGVRGDQASRQTGGRPGGDRGETGGRPGETERTPGETRPADRPARNRGETGGGGDRGV